MWKRLFNFGNVEFRSSSMRLWGSVYYYVGNLVGYGILRVCCYIIIIAKKKTAA